MAAEQALVARAGWAAEAGGPPPTGAAVGPDGAVLMGVLLTLPVVLLAVAAVFIPEGRRPAREVVPKPPLGERT